MAEHTTPTRSSLVCAGADALIALVNEVKRESERQLADYDGRAYHELVRTVETSLDRHFVHSDAAHREGYLRALTDLLCMVADDVTPSRSSGWDPIANTADGWSPAEPMEARDG